jgi:pyroglutamyl-peptidase
LAIHRAGDQLYIRRMVARAEKRSTVLLTGFGPFPGVRVNASADLVRKLARLARPTFPDFRFVSAVLPTEWRRGPLKITALHRQHKPLLALHFGVASDTEGVRLERRAKNACRSSTDAAGQLPLALTLCEGGPEERRVTIDLSAISKELQRRGVSTSISDDAGGYLCNAVLYQSLASAERQGATVGFVHIPAELPHSDLTTDRLAAAALHMIGVELRRNYRLASKRSK